MTNQLQVIKYLFPLIPISLLLLNSCSSLNIVDSWKSDDIETMKNKNILVITRTDNKIIRTAFEGEIVAQLLNKGIKATESNKKFPNFNPNKKVKENQRELIKILLKNEGYSGVILSVVKGVSESTKTFSQGGYHPRGLFSLYYPGYYGEFYGYYHNPGSYFDYGSYLPRTTTTRTIVTYTLETVIYNLDKPKNQQLVAVVTSEIDDPEKTNKLAKKYAKAVALSLKNQ